MQDTPDPRSFEPIVLGIDLGSSSVRGLAVTSTGEVVAAARIALAPEADRVEGPVHEQDPEAWWLAVVAVIRELVRELRDRSIPVAALRALAVDGTSGSVVPVDGQGHAVRPAMMYDDLRATAEAEELTERAGRSGDTVPIPPSFAIAKMLWFARHETAHYAQTVHFAHQADYVAWRLGAKRGWSDYSNSLKSGYDTVEDRWPSWVELQGLRGRLPEVVGSGTPIGSLRPGTAAQLGLPAGMTIVSGATDGTAAVLASGAMHPGDHNTTLGTTLVFKTISRRRCADALIYSHKLPGGMWLPGAASSTGGEWLREYPEAELARLDAEARRRLPCEHLAYPLVKSGERFPFSTPAAKGFLEPPTRDPSIRYAARLQGVALLERLGYAVLDRAVGGGGGDVHATGGACRSEVWMQLRADVTGRTFRRAKTPESAFGAAVLAGGAAVHDGVWEAARAMVRPRTRFEPRAEHRKAYDQLYRAFLEHLRRRGYLTGSDATAGALDL